MAIRAEFSRNQLTLDRADAKAHSVTLGPVLDCTILHIQRVLPPAASGIWRDFASVGIGMQLAPGALQ
jgi:hypothetical protein